MQEFNGTIKAWGNSAGILIPKQLLKQLSLSAGDEVEITMKKKNPLDEIRGALKGIKPRTNKTTDELLKEIDRGWEI